MCKPTKDDLIKIINLQTEALAHLNSEKKTVLLEIALSKSPEECQKQLIEWCAEYILEHWEE